ncbi:AraC family transcriptional regulator [Sedimentibacter sp.]|uniref:helix-turn-helix domain-containing protein n=1 Tax=Sedimentibacter sp. TaxID=1960295 RepID=UPI00289A99B3|nr:AraC family transcriptional regulator [Sedimentibacter sp.]
MEININEIIDYYAKSSTSFAGMFFEKREFNDSNVVIDRRTNPFCGGLIISLMGNAHVTLNGTEYMINPGIIVHAGPNMRVCIKNSDDKPWRLAVIHYRIPENEMSCMTFFGSHFSFAIGENIKIPDLIQQLFLSQSSPGSLALFKTKLLFTNLLGEFFDSAKRQLTDNNSKLTETVMEYIRQNHAEQISISQTASYFGLDRRRLAALFKHHVGMTPSNYLIECRILKAKELLQSCSLPVKQVAECVGYSDSLYFSKAFKKITGISPSEFRESGAQSSEDEI